MNLDGDIFDPNGTLTGGYVDPGQSILSKQEEYSRIQQQIEEMRRDQRGLEEKVSKARKDMDYLTNLKNDMEAKTLKLNLLKEKIKANSNAKIQDKHAGLANDLAVFGEQIEKLGEMEKKYAKEIEELRQEKMGLIDSASKSRDLRDVWKEKAMKIEGEIARLNEEIAGLKKVIYKSEVERENAEAEVKKVEGEIQSGERQYEEVKRSYAEKKKRLFQIKKDFDNIMVSFHNNDDKLIIMDRRTKGR